MLMGMETGIFPAIRVFRHFVEGQRFYQLKFASGEQALVLISRDAGALHPVCAPGPRWFGAVANGLGIQSDAGWRL